MPTRSKTKLKVARIPLRIAASVRSFIYKLIYTVFTVTYTRVKIISNSLIAVNGNARLKIAASHSTKKKVNGESRYRNTAQYAERLLDSSDGNYTIAEY